MILVNPLSRMDVKAAMRLNEGEGKLSNRTNPYL